MNAYRAAPQYNNSFENNTVMSWLLSRAGTGKDFIPGYPSHYYPRVPGNNEYSVSLSVCLSLAHMCIGRIWKCRNVPVIVYKSGLARCGGKLKQVTLNFARICLEFY